MTATTNTTGIKAITKIVTFYSDGTFSEYTPSPGVMPPTYPYPNPLTVPYQPYQQHPPYPWWQNPICYSSGGYPAPAGNSQMWGSPTNDTEERN